MPLQCDMAQKYGSARILYVSGSSLHHHSRLNSNFKVRRKSKERLMRLSC